MLVRVGILMGGKHGNSAAWSSIMPMLAIVAREARQHEQVQAEYAEKLLHVAKVTGKGN